MSYDNPLSMSNVHAAWFHNEPDPIKKVVMKAIIDHLTSNEMEPNERVVRSLLDAYDTVVETIESDCEFEGKPTKYVDAEEVEEVAFQIFYKASKIARRSKGLPYFPQDRSEHSFREDFHWPDALPTNRALPYRLLKVLCEQMAVIFAHQEAGMRSYYVAEHPELKAEYDRVMAIVKSGKPVNPPEPATTADAQVSK